MKLGVVLAVKVLPALLNVGRVPAGSGGSNATGLMARFDVSADTCAMLGFRSS